MFVPQEKCAPIRLDTLATDIPWRRRRPMGLCSNILR